jgi:DeoR family transcriptional regulator of aga operon/DeoR family fructose operon transcriptional repressor
MLRRESVSLVGTWGKAVLEQINIKTSFVSARGFTLDEGLTDVDSEEVAFKRSLVESSKGVVVLIDHSKWGKVALATFCPLHLVKLVITDAQAPHDLVEQVRARGIEVWIADE